MKKSLIFIAGLFALSAMAFAQSYYSDANYKDEWALPVLKPEQLKMTAEAAPKKPFVKSKKNRNILVYSRTDGFRHADGIVAFNALIKELEKNFGGQWKVTLSEDREEFKKENLKKYDCIVINNATGQFMRDFEPNRTKMTGAQRSADDKYALELLANLVEYVENGGGFVGVHAAGDAGHNTPYVDMIGGLFAGHPWGAGNSAVTILIEDKGNKLFGGLWPDGEFKIQDEIYTFVEGYDRDKQRVVMSLDYDRSPKDGGADPMKDTRRKDKDFALSWLKSYGKGRIFYGGFGHRLDVFWRNPVLCEYYMRGIQFALGDLEGVDTKPLGKEQMYKAEAEAAINGIKGLRDIDFGSDKDEKLGAIAPTFFRAYQAATTSKEAASAIEKICVAELKAKSGTLRYRKALSELLQVTGAESSAADIAEIIVRDDAADKMNRYYTESLFISLARTKNPEATKVLAKLASSKTEYLRADAVTALSYQNPTASLKFFADTLNASNADEKMAWTALSAIPRVGTPQAYAALLSAYKTAKSDKIKIQAAQLAFAHSELDSAAAGNFAAEIYGNAKLPDALRTLAAIELVKAGKDIKQDVILEDVIGYLGNFPKTKIPASLEIDKLPEHLQAEMIYALIKRGEGFDKIIAITPKSAGTVLAMAEATAQMGKVEDAEKVAKFAGLLDNRQLDSAAFTLASVKSAGKLLKFVDMASKMAEGSPERNLISKTTTYVDASSSVDRLFSIVTGGGSEKDKQEAIKALENAVIKNGEVFIKATTLYTKAPEALQGQLLRLMVACSRRGCEDNMIEVAQKVMADIKNPATKAVFLRFANDNAGVAGAKMCVEAYKQGLKDKALEALSKWENDSALEPMTELSKEVQAPAEKKAIQSAMITVIGRSGAVDSPAAEFLLANAVDPKDKKVLEKLKRLNLGTAQIFDLKSGITGTALFGAGDLKNAFDGNRNSRWSTGRNREAGQWIQFELPKVRPIVGIILDLNTSTGDSILQPKVYVGESMEDFDEVEIVFTKGANKEDVMMFKAPKKAKLIRIENGGSSGGWWSIHEVVLVDDPAIFKNTKPMPNGMNAAASHNDNNLKNAFDGNIGTRWDTSTGREAGMWFQIGLPQSKKVSSVELLMGNSQGDRVLNPKVYVGDSLDKMSLAKIKYEKRSGANAADVITLEDAPKVKFIRIENTQTSGGYWSVHEVKVN